MWYQQFDRQHPTETWQSNGVGIFDNQNCGANFGASVAVGDFDGDGYDDLAVGASGDKVDGHVKAGSVRVLYGSHRRLTSRIDQIFSQGINSVADTAEPGDAFGTSLTSGDFNCDGYADLAVGAPGENHRTGAVHILYGDSQGLSGLESQFIEHDDQHVLGHTNLYYGSFLAAGNINADRIGRNVCDDLAIGIPGANPPKSSGPDTIAAGAVAVLYGGGHGLGGAATELWHQESGGLPGKNDAADEFGRGVWIMDDNLDGFGDLLAYSAGDDAFYVIYGSPAGLTSDGAHSRSSKESVKGRLRDACIWACELAWLLLPPGPECDCGACEILQKMPPDPCPNCG